MKKHTIYLPLAILAGALAGCSTPKQDSSDLQAAIDASVAGHYGKAMMHEDIAEDQRAIANHVLDHLQKGHYWNIDEKQKGLAAAKHSEQHRLESEKEMCAWLTESHSGNHHFHNEVPRKAAAYFKTGSAVPFKVNHADIHTLAGFLQSHPNAKANVVASTDTVGSPAANKQLSDNRARTVADLLVKHGAKASQLNISSIGEASGPDNQPNQEHRAVMISTVEQLSAYTDCGSLK